MLKKVVFFIEYLPEHELAGRVFMELWRQGIEAERKNPEEAEKLLQSLKKRHKAPAAADAEVGPEELLIVTDMPEVAERFWYMDVAVLGYLHEKNRDASFSGIRYLVEDFSGVDSAYCRMVYARAHGLPLTILQTKRCIVREMTEDDLDRLYEIYADPSVTAYMEPLFEDPDEERAYIRNYIERIYAFYGFGLWSVFEKESGRLIGRAGVEQKEEYVELGYLIAPEYQKQGYATEVCREILMYAEGTLGLSGIRAMVHRDNVASVRLCEKLGFRYTGDEGVYRCFVR